MSYGQKETWKIVYSLPPEQQNAGRKGVALIEATDRASAMFDFQKQYKGQYFVVESCKKLI